MRSFLIMALIMLISSTTLSTAQQCLGANAKCQQCGGPLCCDGTSCRPVTPFPDVSSMTFCVPGTNIQCGKEGWHCNPTSPFPCCQGFICDASGDNQIFPKCVPCPSP